MGLDSLRTRRTLKVGKKSYEYYSLKAAERELGDLSRLPFSLKVILENLLRHEDGRALHIEPAVQFVERPYQRACMGHDHVHLWFASDISRSPTAV